MTPITFDQCVNWVLLDLNRNIYSSKRRKLGDVIRYTFYREGIEIGRVEGILGVEWSAIPTITNHVIEDLQRRGLSLDRENWPPRDDEFDRDFRRISGQIFDKYHAMREKYWENQELIRQYKERKGLVPTGDGKGRKQRGPNAKTQDRGKVFKRIKDEHPTWSQSRVALEASPLLGEFVNENTVRNTYRQLGWKWERADRIR